MACLTPIVCQARLSPGMSDVSFLDILLAGGTSRHRACLVRLGVDVCKPVLGTLYLVTCVIVQSSSRDVHANQQANIVITSHKIMLVDFSKLGRYFLKLGLACRLWVTVRRVADALSV